MTPLRSLAVSSLSAGNPAFADQEASAVNTPFQRPIEERRSARIRKSILAAWALGIMWTGVSSAAVTLTSTIEALQVVPTANGVFVKLTGYPSIAEGACANPWGQGDLDDDKFMTYVWPALLLAHSKGRTVTIQFSGCQGIHPRISWIQVNAGTP